MKQLAVILIIGLTCCVGSADKPNKRAVKPEIVKVDAFKKRYQRVGMAETMHTTEFLGVKDGVVILKVRDMNPLTKGWSQKLIGVKLVDLDPAFRADLEEADKKLKSD